MNNNYNNTITKNIKKNYLKASISLSKNVCPKHVPVLQKHIYCQYYLQTYQILSSVLNSNCAIVPSVHSSTGNSDGSVFSIKVDQISSKKLAWSDVQNFIEQMLLHTCDSLTMLSRATFIVTRSYYYSIQSKT